MKSVKEIKTDLSFVKDYEVVVFGSYAGKRADKRSDIDISEYFYEFRKLWNDMKYRFMENQFQSVREKVTALERYRRLQRGKMAVKA
ncbi:MAG: nucleotidyltransferase domain-containing protein [Euryarchaeota archaeon]|nr:nucleotidyltransferase domain-containing protein [Euryarchaeota archaeon]MBU4492353.1 nucleotidyltransferase domain-containing protein [Euryarchaeota archaeon]MCG2727874.1 nucleotidyltransferase domain-containing protein [Candidatus Methanoperedenaceae archaeon]